VDILKGKVAVVTGAAKGIGESIATEFAAEGARIALVDLDIENATSVAARLSAGGAKAVAYAADVSDEQQVNTAIDRIAAEFAAIHILVNNAGMYPRYKFEELTVEQWDRIQAVNVRSAFLCSRAVLPFFKKQGGGKIVNLSSVTFFVGFPRDLVHYIASKGAIVGFTRSLAKDLGEFNIRVNAITPGAVESEEEKRVATPEQVAAVIALQAIRRRLLPRDIARTAVFLTSADAEMISGQTINVDGGWAMH
jgi:3-oxoacyl-[acyl-carrier protein] reductase